MQPCSSIQSTYQHLNVRPETSSLEKDKGNYSKKSTAVFTNTVVGQSSANNSLISEHRVTVHATSEGVQEEEPSTEIKTPGIEEKK